MNFFKSIKEIIKDKLQTLLWILPRQPEIDFKNDLKSSQIYPYGKNIRKLFYEEAIRSLKDLELKENYKISSIGTCFAEEVSTFLSRKANRYNYIKYEKNIFNFSANWGRVYTVKNLRQIIDYSLNNTTPILIEKFKDNFFDPLREHSVGSNISKKTLEKSIYDHREISKKVFKDSDLLIITLGQNEFWFDSNNNIAWGRTPPLDFRNDQKTFTPQEYTFKQNFDDLNYIIEVLQSNNSELKIIFTVSPVLQYATFLGEDIITRSFKGKSILRSVISEIVEINKNCFYFPSYEMVMAENTSSFNADNRHVKRGKVNQIMSSIERAL